MIFYTRATHGRGTPSLGLMARLGKSIAKQSEGRAGENVARSGRLSSPPSRETREEPWTVRREKTPGTF